MIRFTIQLQHPRLATRVGFNWETSDSVIINYSSSNSSDENEENVEVHTYTHNFLNWVNLINTAGPELRREAISGMKAVKEYCFLMSHCRLSRQ